MTREAKRTLREIMAENCLTPDQCDSRCVKSRSCEECEACRQCRESCEAYEASRSCEDCEELDEGVDVSDQKCISCDIPAPGVGADDVCDTCTRAMSEAIQDDLVIPDKAFTAENISEENVLDYQDAYEEYEAAHCQYEAAYELYEKSYEIYSYLSISANPDIETKRNTERTAYEFSEILRKRAKELYEIAATANAVYQKSVNARMRQI